MTLAHRSRQTRRRSRRTAIAIFIGLAASLAGVGTLAFKSSGPVIDEVTLCPVDLPLVSSTVVLVDTTDTLSGIQSRRLLAAIRDAQADTPIHGKLTLLLLDADAPYEPRELVSLCNPGSGRDANPWTQTTSRIEARWRRSFNAPIRAAIDQLSGATAAPRSPILETLSVITLRPDFDRRTAERRLLIVSDMLHHAPGRFTHYAAGAPWQRYERTGLLRDTVADFSDVAITVEYLRRPQHARHQNAEHLLFWEHWFGHVGARSLTFFGAPRPD